MVKSSSPLFGPPTADLREELIVDNDAGVEPGGFVLGCADRDHRLDLSRKLVTRHILLLGPSGSGKSRGFFMENCARATGGSFVASDPKGELWKTVSGLLPSPLRFAPREPDASETFNWIPLCRDPAMALRLARATIGARDPEGKPRMELSITLAACLYHHAAFFDEPTPASVFDLLTGLTPPRLLEVLVQSDAEAARRYASVVALAGVDALHAAAVGVAQSLIFLADPDLRRFTSARRETMDFTALRRAPTALFWIVREDDMGTLRPLAAIFFTALLHACKQPGGTVPITLFLDEFANVCDVPDFETEITIARGEDIAFVISLQSISQLERHYGQANASTIYENCQTTIALPGLSSSTAELVARGVGAQGRVSTTTTADEIRRLNDKDMLVIMTNRAPFRIRRRKYRTAPCEASTAALGPALTTKLEGVPAESTGP
jgi:type IV secretion system protein VirD4